MSPSEVLFKKVIKESSSPPFSIFFFAQIKFTLLRDYKNNAF